MFNCNCNKISCETCKKRLLTSSSIIEESRSPIKNDQLLKTQPDYDFTDEEEDYDDDPSQLLNSDFENNIRPFIKGKFKRKKKIKELLDSIPESISKENMAALLEKLAKEENERKKSGSYEDKLQCFKLKIGFNYLELNDKDLLKDTESIITLNI
jgi:hypothetical protein